MHFARRLCLNTMAALLSISATAFAADQNPLKTEPYVWDNVAMKGTGFIDGIAFGRSAPNTLYMHTDMGGAYRYDYAKQRWVCLTDWIQWDDGSLRHGGVETAAVDPSDANRVYFGIGTYMGKSAIIYSDDGTKTLKRTDVPFPMNGNGNGRNAGERMQVDPSQGNILFYGTRNMGLWKSNDYAKSWSRVDSFPAVGDERGPAGQVGINFVLFDKASATANQPTPVIYVGVATVEANKLPQVENAVLLTEAGKLPPPAGNGSSPMKGEAARPGTVSERAAESGAEILLSK
jgi:hypothetical protein